MPLDECRRRIKAWLVIGDSLPDGPRKRALHVKFDLRKVVIDFTEDELDHYAAVREL